MIGDGVGGVGGVGSFSGLGDTSALVLVVNTMIIFLITDSIPCNSIAQLSSSSVSLLGVTVIVNKQWGKYGGEKVLYSSIVV